MDALVVLDEAECRELLTTMVVGRVAVTTPQGPRIVPVNYSVHKNRIVFRTAAYSELATYAKGQPIAFEADHLDPVHHRGWSVIAHGSCAVVEDPDLLHWASAQWAPEPWAGGDRHVILMLAWSELTGRRVGGPHWPHPPTPRFA
jgi:hypothetical protein